MNKIGFVSLGCPKALVDSENILSNLKASGYEIVNSYQDANLVIINTCGFIDSAVAESIETIGEAILENGKVIVTGCLGAKPEVILNAHPKVLGITGPDSLTDVVALVHAHLPISHNPLTDINYTQVKLTPKHYSYLKIAEGCNNSCSFCVIPSMRGKLNSYPIGEVLDSAQKLVKNGTKELLVISQDTAAYGVDVKYKTGFQNGRPVKTKLLDLCNELSKLGVWVRLHYLYPYPNIDELIPLMQEGKILPYLDIPLQHASERVLKLMKRPGNIEKMLERINSWRAICPNLVIRSTFIVGFPGETEDDFTELLNFLTKAQLDKVGCFKYSDIDGAPANSLQKHVSDEVKEERYNRFMQHQLEISLNKGLAKVGKILPVIIDGIEKRKIIARTMGDAPEIDGLVYIKSINNQHYNIGDIINVEITDANEYDLFGVIATN